jgi:REP element-mobilizing transposase RayT
MVERLRRLDWVFSRAPIYFVTACTFDRRALLARECVREKMFEFAQKGPDFGVWLGAFVLMPDHVHAFVALAADESSVGLKTTDLGRWMKGLKRAISQSLDEAGVEGQHSQKGFFDHVLRSEESYVEKWEYVRLNPVRAGLVERAEDWPFFGEPFPLECRGEQD